MSVVARLDFIHSIPLLTSIEISSAKIADIKLSNYSRDI